MEDIATIAKESLAKLGIRAKYADFKEVYRVSSNTRSPILIRLVRFNY